MICPSVFIWFGSSYFSGRKRFALKIIAHEVWANRCQQAAIWAYAHANMFGVVVTSDHLYRLVSSRNIVDAYVPSKPAWKTLSVYWISQYFTTGPILLIFMGIAVVGTSNIRTHPLSKPHATDQYQNLRRADMLCICILPLVLQTHTTVRVCLMIAHSSIGGNSTELFLDRRI